DLFTWSHPAAAGLNPPGTVPLFPAISRPAPSGLAAVRAELWDPLAQAPAAGAVLEVRLGAPRLGLGVADMARPVARLVAYPPPPARAPGLPSPLGPPPAYPDLTWPVALAARYGPAPARLGRGPRRAARPAPPAPPPRPAAPAA